MAKIIRDEDLRLNIIINGDNGRKQMGELERAIHDTNSKLETLYAKRKKLEQQGKQDTQAYRNLSAQIGKNTKAIEGYREKLEALRRQQSVNTMTLSELTSHINRVRAQLAKTDPKTPLWKQLNAELKTSSARLAELRAQSKATGGAICTMAERANRYIGLITAGFATLTAVFSGVNRAKESFKEWDEAIADAMKTTQLSREEMLLLNADLKKIDTRTSQNRLLGLTRIAGKLGIDGRDSILQFVGAADKIDLALGEDLGGDAEDAIREIGKLVDIFNLEGQYGLEQSMLKTGSAINSLGMASTANEGYIVNFTKRIAGIAPNANIAIDKVLGLAATLDKYGQMSETAATAVGQTITGMYKRTEDFARVAHMSFGAFKELLEKDANEAFIRVLEGMNKGGEGMTTVVKALDSLNLQGQRASTVLGSLAKHSDELRNQQLLANQAFDEGTSIIDEFNTKNNTATAQSEKRKKALVDEAVALGETLVPAMNVSLSTGTWMIRVLNTLVTVGIKHRAIIIGLAATYAAYVVQQKAQVAWSKLQVFWSAANRAALANEVVALNGAKKSTMLLCAAKNLLVGNLKAAGTAFKSFFAAMGPIGWATLAIGAIVTAYNAWKQSADETNESMEAMERINKRVAEETGDERAKIASLTNVIHDNKRGILARKAAIEELQKIIPEYNGSLTDEGELINDNTTAINNYITALERKIRLQAAEAELAELYTKKRKLEQEQESARNDRNNATPDGPWNQSLFEQWTGIDLVKSDYKKADERFSKATDEIAEVNRAISVLEKEVADGYETTLTVNVTTTGGDSGSGDDDDNNDDDDGGNGSSWSLGSDADFLKKRLALKNQFLSGEIATEEAYNAQLLDLEIATLQKRLAADADSAEDRLAIQEQLTDKLLEKQQAATKEQERQAKEQQQQSEQALREQEELAMEIARMSDDRVAIENANYEKLKRKYEGNAEALEALERAHQARLNKIKLDEFDDDTEKRQAQYQVERRMMESRHRQELESFKGSQRGLRELRKKQWKELNDLDEQYLTEMIAQLSNLVNNGKIGDIEIGIALSDADKAKLLQQIAELQEELDKLRGASQNTQETSSGGGEFWGLSQEEWADLFNGNLENWDEWADAITDIVSAAADQMMQLWGAVDKYMTATENHQLKLFEKNNDKKKKALEKRLNAGLITEAQYNSEVEALDAEYDAFQEELQLKQAKRQKAMNITQAIINTALGVTMTLAQWGVPWGLIPAGIMAAMGAAEIALIAATPITTGAEEGGPIGGGDPISVRRAQDGKPFRARLNPSKRGFVSTPTVIVAENGTEYVMPNEALQNPTVYPLLSAMETARRNGTLDTLNFSAIYSPYSVVGRAIGGYIGQSGNASSISPSGGTPADIAFLYEMLERVLTRLDEPLNAQVVMLGKNGFVEKWEQYQKQRQRGKLG